MLLADLGPLVDVLTTLYTTIERRTKSRVIIDSSKNPAFGYLLGSVPELDVRYLHLVRDAPAVAYSLGKRKESEPGRRLPRKGPWQSSLDWTMRNIAAERHLRRRPMMRIRYEDLVSDPSDMVTAVCELLDEDPGDLSFLSGANVAMRVRPHSVFGNPGRFRHGDTTLRADTEWKTRMNSADVFIVKAVTLPLRLRYGYVVASARRG
jgi:hypothetical protein